MSDDLKGLIASCDLKLVNFEVPLKPDADLPPIARRRFFQHDDAPAFLREHGFNLFPLANNHILDWGEAGLVKTITALGDGCFGAGTYKEALTVKVCEIDGIRIGFLAVCFAAYAGVFSDVSDHEGMGCAYINDLQINHIIIEAKKYVDYLFILPHDGIEYLDIPMPETVARYRDFIDFGADGVFATHPHCPQGWECYNGKPVFYSLGNFLFNSMEGYSYRATNRMHWYEGLCVILSITGRELSWEVVNTRNVDNIRIVVDADTGRTEHNQLLCRYLSDRKAYDAYLEKACRETGDKEIAVIDRSFYHIRWKINTMFVWWLKSFFRKPLSNVTGLQNLLKHDTRRSFLERSIKRLCQF